jgi:hypothetical protein
VLEDQLDQLLAERFRLSEGWQEQCLKAFCKPQAAQSDHRSIARQHLERAKEKLLQQFRWNHVEEGEYLIEFQKIDRQLGELAPVPSPTQLPDVRRAGELLANFAELWSHPGVSQERRKEFVDEVFQEIQLDEQGIRAILVHEPYKPLFALAQEVGGDMVGATGLEPATS